jgi:hypothetical protein
MLWDPEVESPASIAVVGGGPVGIEAALYARFLGYEVDIFDQGRPARALTRWHQRSLAVELAAVTTSLGHAALEAQDSCYRRPDLSQVWTGQEFAEAYLIPLAKSDLLYDAVHINSRVVDVSRSRVELDEGRQGLHRGLTRLNEAMAEPLQERANDEFRLVIESRDRGSYIARADLILDCRGWARGVRGWGPGGGKVIEASPIDQQTLQRWLPRDPRFEWRQMIGKQTLLFGRSRLARRFAEEWAEDVQGLSGHEQQSTQLLWLVPGLEHEPPPLAGVAVLPTLGVERVGRDDQGRWQLQLRQADDSTVEVAGDHFAPFPAPRPSEELGKELLSTSQSLPGAVTAEASGLATRFYQDWPGWKTATLEPHYYRLGSSSQPHHPAGLPEAFAQIRDLFALLGGRADLNLYQGWPEASGQG